MGEANEKRMPNFKAPTINEFAILFGSPIKQTFKPSNEPLYSRIVNKSAKIWQGCEKSVKPLITGTLLYSANSSTIA